MIFLLNLKLAQYVKGNVMYKYKFYFTHKLVISVLFLEERLFYFS